MGRDDARAIAGLQGGTAPARAFHDFMVKAVARRPVENFTTEVPMPNWDLGDEEDLYANEVAFEPLVDENGNPLPGQPTDPVAVTTPGQPIQQPQTGQQLDQQWLDQVLPPGSTQRPQPQRQQPPRPVVVRPPPPPSSARPPDPLEPAPDPSQQ